MSTAPPTISSEPKTLSGLSRLRQAWINSMRGLRMAYQGERAFRQEAALAVVLVPLSFWVGRSWVEVALLAGCIWLLMIVELLNSAIEAAIDRIGPERHVLSGRAKDVASAAVWMALMMCVGIWGAALWARFAA
ncbi:MAG TPA: diacylglycerol kinase [Ideonella sp.]|uniref:diacylglycerol kinase n=1 Tax=Ideonella sp. TaxID=1929293 RepID=UPI002E2EABE1|nr:diacylglycerol kinase [Ideonella sp.]HEX5684396.1 diacylglycerol kinase [Ideonella sp.]